MIITSVKPLYDGLVLQKTSTTAMADQNNLVAILSLHYTDF